jgi:RNAse (barnase) inhibitor barstar
MNIDWDQFAVGVDWRPFQSSSAWVAPIARGISDEPSLFSALATTLRFPNYFGKNWDAVLDLLRDFSWIHERDILIVHADVPAIPRLSTYLEVLSIAMKAWPAGEEHRLLVYFPCDSAADLRMRVASTLAPSNSRN